jgi:hypothetical protein
MGGPRRGRHPIHPIPAMMKRFDRLMALVLLISAWCSLLQ